MCRHAASSRRALSGAGTAFLLALAVPAAHAAEKSPADTTKPVMFLKETVVTGSRYPRQFFDSPQALSFVNRAQIREQLPVTIGDVLQQLPGVDNSKDSPWEQRPVIRGLAGQRVLVLVDGSPMNSARGNGPHPSLVDPSQIERVEVVRGPSSVSYGSDAIGGVINIITRQAGIADGSTSLLRGGATVGGSSADRGYNATVYLTPQVGKLTSYVSSGMSNAEDFRTPDHGRVAHSGFNAYNALANLRYQWSDRTALKGGWQLYRGHDIGLPGLDFSMPGFEQVFNFPYYRRDEASLGVEHRHAASSWLATSSARVYWQNEGRNFYSHMAFDNSFFGPGTPPGTFVDNTDRYLKLNTTGLQLQATTRGFGRGAATFGVDVARDATDGTNLDVVSDEAFGPPSSTVSRSLPTGRFDNYGTYVQSAIDFAPRVTLDFGGRYTHYRDRTDFGVASPASNAGGPPQPEVDFDPRKVDDDALAGSAGLVVAVNDDLHLTANVANGYRQPNAQDLFFRGPASVGLVVGNSELKPEKSVSGDVGLRWGPGKLAFSGNLFYSTYTDLIDAIQIATASSPGGQATYQYVNISEARIWGGEAEGQWQFLPRWMARAAVTGAVGDITSRDAIRTLYNVDADKAPLPNVPPLKGSAALRWTSPGSRLWVEPGMRYSWRTNRLPLPTADVSQITAFKKEWLVGDLFAGYRIADGQRIEVGVKNFTDRAYQLPIGSLEEPGISFVGSLSTSF